MEKPGRRFRGKQYCRLLICALLCLCALPLWAQRAEVTLSSPEVYPGETVVLELFIYGVLPAEVSLEMPSPQSVTGKSSRKELRRTVFDSATVYISEWESSVPGSHALGPFLLTVRDGERIILDPVYFTVISPERDREPASVRWFIEGRAETIRQGDEVSLLLAAVFSGEVTDIRCPVTEDSLLEGPFAVDTGPAGYRPLGRWVWTPLGAGTRILPQARVRWRDDGGQEREMYTPELSREVLPSVTRPSGASSVPELDVALASAFSDTGRDSVPDGFLPASTEERDALVRRLAALRSEEYRLLFSSGVRAERLALEAELNVASSFPVPPAAWKHPLFFMTVACAFLCVIAALVMRRRSGRALSHVFLLLTVVLAFFTVSVYIRDRYRQAVIFRSDFTQVPEKDSRVIESFPGGTSVRILRSAGQWFYAETPSGFRGWVPASRALVTGSADQGE